MGEEGIVDVCIGDLKNKAYTIAVLTCIDWESGVGSGCYDTTSLDPDFEFEILCFVHFTILVTHRSFKAFWLVYMK